MVYSKSFGFGSGFLFMTPTGASDNTPVRVGVMQNVSLEFSFDEKPLYGQNQFPEAVARGKAKLTSKCAFAQIDSRAIGEVFLGGTPAAGQEQIVDLEAASVPTTPFTITVAGATNYTGDLGVFYATTGQPLQQVTAGSEATGKYSVTISGANKGKYVFATGDSLAAVLISYTKNDTTTGFKTTISNQAMGSYIPFQADLFQNNPETAGTQWGARLYKCASHKLAMASKQDDWLIPDMDFSVYANPAGKVMDFNSPN